MTRNKIVRTGLERMRAVIPDEMIDPVLRNFALQRVAQLLKSILRPHYDLIQRYAENVFGQIEFEHPFDAEHGEDRAVVGGLAVEWKRAAEQLQKFADLGELCRPPNHKVSRK